MLLVSKFINEEKKRAWKSYHEKLINTEFLWDKSSLSHADTINSIPCSIDKDMLREQISKIKNGKAAVLSDVVSEKVKTAGEAGAEVMT